ncbi:3288_t:CDS:2 [Paraglomus occultum]|uniref:3288_t:CDS:1 n=1 Tax=Paraglomus occultum TaxID=144539 RepID=A0A9N9CFT9_9GLOM|nr:3288_t:CDS:2 [Paraglomus occultum]
MVILTDEQRDPKLIPTRSNIIAAMRWLVNNAAPNDSFFLHFSGHGGQKRDNDGDEEDGYDETIMPLDFQTAGEIVDDEMHAILVRPLPAGCRLTVIFDSCHSGTALDLPYVYSTKGLIKEPNLLSDAKSSLMDAGKSYLRGDIKAIGTTLFALGKKAATGQKVARKNRETKSSPADVIMFSGCKDLQTSADTMEAGQNTGAMSYAFIKTLSQNRNITYKQLLYGVREILAAKYSQKPQLSS